MKSQASQQVRVGIFVTLGLVLSMLVIFLLGDLSGIFQQRYTLYARFDDISGLRIGAPIFLAGINVGKVEEIKFPGQLEERKVIVEMKVGRAYHDRIREDSTASITTQGLLGDKAIFITVGTPNVPELKSGSEMKVREGLSLESFGEKGAELLENVNTLAGNINKLVADVKEKDSLIHALLYDPKGREAIDDLSGVLGGAKDIVLEIKRGDGVLHGLIYEKDRQKVGEKLSKTVANFEVISRNMKEVSVKIDQGEGSIGGLVNDPTVYYDLMTLLGNANRNKLLRTVIRATLATNEKDLTGN